MFELKFNEKLETINLTPKIKINKVIEVFKKNKKMKMKITKLSENKKYCEGTTNGKTFLLFFKESKWNVLNQI
jgi:hypothetical protein